MRAAHFVLKHTLQKCVFSRTVRGVTCAFLFYAVASRAAQAHLMVEQHGTVNIVGDSAFMVLSLPVSAFVGVDDDGDGKLSMAEFVARRAEISAAVTRKVQLFGAHGARPLEGIMLSLSPSDDAPQAPVAQLVVMGRFALSATPEKMSFKLTLFGNIGAEQKQEITITRGAEKQRMVLTPKHNQREVLPSVRRPGGAP